MRFEWDETKRVANLKGQRSPLRTTAWVMASSGYAVSKISSSQRSMTDWSRVDAMSDADIDLSDAPEITPEMFALAIVRRGGLKPVAPKTQITLRVDAEVLEWFRSRGTGYQSQMNAVLRAYKEAHEKV